MHEVGISEQYLNFIEELKAVITEGVYRSRQELIETYHTVGSELESHRDYEVSKLAKDSGLSEQTLKRCVRFVKKYPSLDHPDLGKNISWRKIVNELLIEGTREDKPKEEITCPRCLGSGKITK